jgi:hypothetical protein
VEAEVGETARPASVSSLFFIPPYQHAKAVVRSNTTSLHNLALYRLYPEAISIKLQTFLVPPKLQTMKVILTGSSGFIGAEVLRQCLRNPSITSLVALSRRELPVAPDPKLKTVLVENWEAYEPDVLREMEGAEACIWYVA